jgi:beta-fructofuranosidase
MAMALRLPDKWVWDFWLAHDTDHHVFYLQAPRSLGRSELRHHNASIGHAVSSDLTNWAVLPDALQPGPAGSWDDLATWTGSVISHDDRWYMLYTGINRSEGGLIQRIGLAISDDLTTWSKHPDNPVIEVDPRWYERLDLTRWCDQSWRDPWLFIDPADGTPGCLITARSRDADPDGAGVIARARSHDFVHWDILPPVTPAGEFAQVECPQLVLADGRSLIIFSCLEEDHAPARLRRLGRQGETGTYFFAAPDLWGHYTPSSKPIADPAGAQGPLYAGKLVADSTEQWRFLAFRGAGNRAFVGELTDPLPLTVERDGALRVADRPLATPGRNVACA